MVFFKFSFLSQSCVLVYLSVQFQSNQGPDEDMDMSGEPDTTQDDGEEFQQNGE